MACAWKYNEILTMETKQRRRNTHATFNPKTHHSLTQLPQTALRNLMVWKINVLMNLSLKEKEVWLDVRNACHVNIRHYSGNNTAS